MTGGNRLGCCLNGVGKPGRLRSETVTRKEAAIAASFLMERGELLFQEADLLISRSAVGTRNQLCFDGSRNATFGFCSFGASSIIS